MADRVEIPPPGIRLIVALAMLLVALSGCVQAPTAVAPSPQVTAVPAADESPSAPGAATPAPASPSPPAPPKACGDPVAHVYHAYRLELIDRCRTVSGVIRAIRSEADGDYHVLLALDPQYADMLRAANTSGQHGDLVLEPICQHAVTQADAMAPCGGGLPLVPIPPIGTHVSATGSYVLDSQHGGWAELHPLFEIHPG